ncbi:MAG: SDR family NAD(P)-dependent oxidoreductase [Pseudomonadota bacterium]
MEKSSARVALVTGAANGIGKTISLALAAQGIRVAAVDRDGQALDALHSEAHGLHDGALVLETFTADLSAPDAASVVPEVLRCFGQVDILVNNAGVGQIQVKPDYHEHPPRFYEVSEEQWQRAVAVNASAVFLLSRAVAPAMVERGWGRIINVTTSLGTMLRAGYTPYGPSKAAAEALSAVMAGDLEGTGVTVNVVVPGGVVNTRMIPSAAPFARDELIQPQIMLAPIEYLLSRDGDGVTGKRFLGSNWKSGLSPAEAAQVASAPIGWRDIAMLPVVPKKSRR